MPFCTKNQSRFLIFLFNCRIPWSAINILCIYLIRYLHNENLCLSRKTVKGFRRWHFLCIQWNGIAGTVTYFYDGYAVDSKIQDETLKTQLPPGKNFSIGLGDGTGKLTQLNIWDYEIATGSVVAMSSGGFNVHGSVLSWSSLAKNVSDASIDWGSSNYLPGKTEDLNKFLGSPLVVIYSSSQLKV